MHLKKLFLFSFFAIVSTHSHASQLGPVFPTHHFPTTESIHLGYSLGFARSASNFVGSTTTDILTDNASLKIFSHRFIAEIQPNPRLSAGLILVVNQMNLGDPVSNLSVKKSGFGDQRFWGEYRLYDVVGASLGVAVMGKFPGYKNPSSQDLQDQNLNSVALLGDAQTDFSVLLTGERWFSENFRTRLDGGITYRSEGYATEVPFNVSLGIVNPKVDFEFRVKGNFTLGNDSLGASGETPQGISELRNAFAGSNYALAENPWIVTLNPYLELWTNNRFALTFEYQYSLLGSNVPHYHYFGAGMTMRWARNKTYRPREYEKVDMSTEQEPEKFQGEYSEKELAPKAKPDTPAKEVETPDEEFR